ncbi:MAG: pyrroloquinoline quinone-dependent dehydrogenase [Gemmatimonadaceae bacterium]
MRTHAAPDASPRQLRSRLLSCVLALGMFVVACRTGEQKTAGATAAGTRWHSYNRGYDGQRYADIDQITPANVGTLAPVCQVKLGEEGPFQAGPLVLGDTLIITTARTTAALNATNCAQIWRHVDEPKGTPPISVNRGAAYLDGRIYRGTPDGRLYALDAKTGATVWEDSIGNPGIGEFVSSAPVAWNGTVFVGLAGSDWGIRGHMMAFDAATGKEKWRFYTIPMGSEPGAESWHIPATAHRGGGAQWTSYALDTATSEVFVPVANPSPDFAPQSRPGDNLYTNSLVVLDVATGKLKWYYQLRANDGFDWDLGAAPMLYSAGGNARVALGSKDGFVYAVDRGSHKLAFKTAVTTIANADSQPTPKGVTVCPGPLGGVEWNGPAYDPKTNMIYVGAVDWCATYTTTTGTPTYSPGGVYMGTSYVPPAGTSYSGWLTALDAGSGQVKWKFHAPQPIVAAVTPTSGGVVFNGDLGGDFYAFDAETGKVLLTLKTPGAIAGGIVTYVVGGKQYVATTSGNISRSTFKTGGSPTIIIMALGAKGAPASSELPAVKPPASSIDPGAPPADSATPPTKGKPGNAGPKAATKGKTT